MEDIGVASAWEDPLNKKELVTSSQKSQRLNMFLVITIGKHKKNTYGTLNIECDHVWVLTVSISLAWEMNSFLMKNSQEIKFNLFS